MKHKGIGISFDSLIKNSMLKLTCPEVQLRRAQDDTGVLLLAFHIIIRHYMTSNAKAREKRALYYYRLVYHFYS